MATYADAKTALESVLRTGARGSISPENVRDAITTLTDAIVAIMVPTESPAFTGTPTAPTATLSDNTQQIATTAFVQGLLAQAFGDVLLTANNLSDLDSASDARSNLGLGAVALLSSIAQSDVTGLVSALAAKAPLASPALTGNPTAPNQSASDSSTKIANTAYVDAAVSVLAAVVSGALVFKGAWDASAGTFPGSGRAQTGYFYKVTVAGTVNGVAFTVGDDIYAVTNNASTSTYASNWLKVEGSITSAEIAAALGYTPLAPANNLSEIASASSARSNLGLVIGTNVQAYNALLAAIAGLTIAKGSLIAGSGAGALSALGVGSDGQVLTADAASAPGVKWTTLSIGSGDLVSTNNLSDLSSKKTGYDNLSIHGADIASAATINLESATGNLVDVTGTTTITAITLSEGHERTVRFTGALTLTHGSSLVLPGGASITTAAGDYAIFRGYAAGVVRCVSYVKASGKPTIAPAFSELTSQAAGLAAAPFGPFTTLASASTCDLSSIATVGVSITGTTTITSFGTGASLLRMVKFTGALTLTHNATSLILPGGANITTAAGDRLIALSDGSGNWTVISYTKADGTAVVSGASSGAAKAWVCFDGATGTIRSAYNVSSVTRTATGKYNINFTSAMANTNYAVLATSHYIASAPYNIACEGSVARTTSAVSVETWESSTYGAVDVTHVNVAVFGS